MRNIADKHQKIQKENKGCSPRENEMEQISELRHFLATELTILYKIPYEVADALVREIRSESSEEGKDNEDYCR